MSSYSQILKSTSIIGGSSLIKMVIGMVRTKFVALLLGPAGVGLIGVYSSITGMMSVVSGMGIGTSGVRQIAEAHGAGDEARIARTVKTLRRTVWVTGTLGMAIMMLGSYYLSRISFGNTDHVFSIALLAITILLTNIAAGQGCILQGTRRIGDLARVSIIGALNGTILSIPCYYFWGQAGIVPGLILISAAALAASWWYARQVPLKPVSISWKESRDDASGLLRFGIPLMLAGLMTALTGYLIRIYLIREVGVDGVGIWLAAFSLSSILINFVLNAMSADYFPRLAAVAHDNKLLNQAVNDQTEVALLLAVPGLAATIIFAPFVIKIFYSGKFDASIDILRWSVYGIYGRVISWPLGFVMLARGMGKTFFWSETFLNVFYLGTIWCCTKTWGLPGTGIAFMLLYVFYTAVVYAIGHSTAGVNWAVVNCVQIALFGILLISVGLISAWVADPWYQYTINIAILAGASGYCLQRLKLKAGVGIKAILKKIKTGSHNT